MAVKELYEQTLRQRGFQADAAQLHAIAALQRCETEWADYKARRGNALTKLMSRPPIPRGVYMHGGVGRGKSFLMDCFFLSVPLQRKTRLHFHEFMREVHRELAELHGTANPLQELARRIARRHRLICFDEFHVADVTDAMILHRLLEALFENRVSIVATSNFRPEDLYPERLAPRTHPAGDCPARGQAGNRQRRQRHRLPAARPGSAGSLSSRRSVPRPMPRCSGLSSDLAETQDEDPVLHIEHRELRTRRRAGGVVWFDFSVLCGGPRSQNDYLELATRFHTVFLSDVPQMSPRLASEARRFTWLVDVLYDRNVKLILSAAVPPEALYTEGPLAHEFPRTVSRLREMQSAQFLNKPRRVVDTALT